MLIAVSQGIDGLLINPGDAAALLAIFLLFVVMLWKEAK